MPDVLENRTVVSAPPVDLATRGSSLVEQSKPSLEKSVSLDYSWQLMKVSLPLVAGDLLSALTCLLATWGGVLWLGKEVNHFAAFAACDLLALSFCLWGHGLYPALGLNPARELQQLFRAIVSCALVACCILCILSSVHSPYVWMVASALPLQLAAIPVTRSFVRSFLRRLGVGIPFYFLGERQAVSRAYHNMRHFGGNLLVPKGRFAPLGEFDSAREIPFASDEEELCFERKVRYLGVPDELSPLAARQRVYWLCVVGDLPTSASEVTIRAFPGLIFMPAAGTSRPPSSVMQCGLTQGFLVEQNLVVPAARIQKRVLDIFVSATALIVLSPLILLIAGIVKLTSRGPVLFSHERIGRGEEMFRAWKFRSMVSNAQQVLDEYLAKHPELLSEWKRDHKLKNDPRVTWIGRILRKTSLDELPQLWNVLVGDMSLVGPRPIVEEEIAKYGDTYLDYVRVSPGITGLWQVSGRNNTSYGQRLALDEYYVRNWSPWLDLYILLRTIKTVLFCEGAY